MKCSCVLLGYPKFSNNVRWSPRDELASHVRWRVAGAFKQYHCNTRLPQTDIIATLGGAGVRCCGVLRAIGAVGVSRPTARMVWAATTGPWTREASFPTATRRTSTEAQHDPVSLSSSGITGAGADTNACRSNPPFRKARRWTAILVSQHLHLDTPAPGIGVGMAWIYYARREVPIGPRRCLINNLVRFVRDSPSPTYTSSQHFKANLVVLDLLTGLLEGQVLQVFSILFSATEAWSANVEAVLLV